MRSSPARLHLLLILISLLTVVASGRAATDDVQSSPVVEEQLEVREVGVVADLPASLRGRSASDLDQRLMILEGGIERRPTSVAALAGPESRPYSRVLLVFDRARCSQPVLEAGAAALGAAAESLVELGPVELAMLGESLETRAAATHSSSELAASLARVSREERCGAPPPADRMTELGLGAGQLVCPGAPCLLVWIGPGWGEAPDDHGAVRGTPPDAKQVEPLARTLSSHGWVVLAAPIGATAAPKSQRSIAEPQTAPGSDSHTFGINVLAWKRKQPLSPEEYGKFVDVWLTPLRQLVHSTAGEFVTQPGELAGALRSLAGRSMLYYRTDRRPQDEPPALVVRARGGAQEAYRTAGWAPSR